jgi:cytidine deaminase
MTAIRNHSFDYTSYSSLSSLNPRDRELLNHALKALPNSYAPYSQFHVAAAIRLNNGEVITGTNQENAAYPSGLCAERVAIFAAMHKFPGAVIEDIAITAFSEAFVVDHPIPPCGACRQVLLEYELRQSDSIRLILRGQEGGAIVIPKASSLLPLYFHESGLKK